MNDKSGDKNNPSGSLLGKMGRIASMRTAKSKKDKYNGGHKHKERVGSTKEEESEVCPELVEALERIKHLPTEDFNKMFEKMLDDMNLSEAHRNPIRDRDMDTKRDMMISFKRRQLISEQQSSEGPSSASDYVKELQRAPENLEALLNLLQSCRVSLTGRPLSWIQEFGESGMHCLLSHLRNSCSSTGNVEKRIQHECVRCLKAFMNNKYGLSLTLKSKDGLTLLARSMDPVFPSMMTDVVKVIAAVCLVEHERTLEAMTICGEMEKKGRFSKIVEALHDDHTALKVACIQLINSLVSRPEDLDFRLHLRNEFIREGLNDAIQDLRDLDNDDLNVQLDVFEDHKEDDSLEFQQRWKDITINFEDTVEIFQVVNNLVQDTPADHLLLSILQHFLLIRDDVYARPQYYKLIEECVSQIVLHRSGVDPDFATRRFQIDVEPLIEGLVDKAKYEEATDKSSQLETKLEIETTMRQECEAKLNLATTNSAEKIKSLENEIEELKKGGAQPGGGSVPHKTIGVAPPRSRVRTFEPTKQNHVSLNIENPSCELQPHFESSSKSVQALSSFPSQSSLSASSPHLQSLKNQRFSILTTFPLDSPPVQSISFPLPCSPPITPPQSFSSNRLSLSSSLSSSDSSLPSQVFKFPSLDYCDLSSHKNLTSNLSPGSSCSSVQEFLTPPGSPIHVDTHKYLSSSSLSTSSNTLVASCLSLDSKRMSDDSCDPVEPTSQYDCRGTPSSSSFLISESIYSSSSIVEDQNSITSSQSSQQTSHYGSTVFESTLLPTSVYEKQSLIPQYLLPLSSTLPSLSPPSSPPPSTSSPLTSSTSLLSSKPTLPSSSTTTTTLPSLSPPSSPPSLTSSPLTSSTSLLSSKPTLPSSSTTTTTLPSLSPPSSPPPSTSSPLTSSTSLLSSKPTLPSSSTTTTLPSLSQPSSPPSSTSSPLTSSTSLLSSKPTLPSSSTTTTLPSLSQPSSPPSSNSSPLSSSTSLLSSKPTLPSSSSTTTLPSLSQPSSPPSSNSSPLTSSTSLLSSKPTLPSSSTTTTLPSLSPPSSPPSSTSSPLSSSTSLLLPTSKLALSSSTVPSSSSLSPPLSSLPLSSLSNNLNVNDAKTEMWVTAMPAPPPPSGAVRAPPPPPPPPPEIGGAPPPPPGMGGGPPPPPPPGMGGGPPPPPPPPGMGGGPPPPPPPPGMGGPPRPPGGMPPPFAPPGQQLPPGVLPKKKYKPEIQTKRANWNKINTRNLTENCFWAKTKEDKLERKELFEELSRTFAAKSAQKKLDKEDGGEKPVQKKKAKELKVLDPKSAQNMSIFLGSMKLSHEEIKKHILRCDQEKLSVSALESLLKYLPSADQMDQLSNMKDNISELSDAEQFACHLSDIKNLEKRLNSMLFMLQFPEEMADTKPNVVNATAACREVKTSPKFGKLLELILLLGNYMNAGSRNEGTIGFEMNYLTKLNSTKSVDGHKNLLHFLAESVEEKYPEIAGFENELSHIEAAGKVSEEILTKSINNMQSNLKKIENELKVMQKNPHPDDRFHEVMKEFYDGAKDQVDVLEEMQKNMTTMFKEVLEFFCMDPKKVSMEEFFGDLKIFIDQYMASRKENYKRQEKEEKDRKAKERAEKEKERKKQKESEKQKRNPLVDMNMDDDQEGVLDGLMQALQTGSAFRDPSRPPRKKAQAKKGGRPVDLRRSRTRSNIPVQKIMEAQELASPANGNDANEENNPTRPRRRNKDQRAESEAQDLLEQLKNL